ncbi:Protein disulfide-isomerase A6 [Erysiphe neolycopersici]|uniref:protein disulfide-isomerase n=1 Tax=Erysiphe neolycopersici TaxID=212602 RepID=A0A420HQP1_9PEZI|nr:Protein disulfide-isomerase A6 [Erysiphe neolycopersici]
MIYTTLTIATTLLLAIPAKANLYPKSLSILSINGNDYDRIIAQSNYTSIVKFYSPHCIHCKNLVPTYEKVAQKLKGLAKVAAVNCEKESNQLFCDRIGISGFPTLKIVKPGKTPGKPIVQEYSGARSAESFVKAVIDKIPNLVEKLPEENVEKWIQDAGESPVAILFTNKPRINPLLKALAIEFKGNIKFAHVQVSDDGEVSAEKYEIKKLPTIVLVKGGKIDELIRYDDDMKKDLLVEFLSQGAAPNPDPAPVKTKTTDQSSTQKQKILKPTNTPITVSPLPIVEKELELIKECLGPKTSTCLIALLPQSHDSTALNLIDALTQVTHKYKQQKRSSIPTFILPESNPQYENLKNKLSLESKAVVVAVNGKRSWWVQMTDADFSSQSAIELSLEQWISAIQLGEGEKKKIPTGLISEESEKILTDIKVEKPSDSLDSSDENKLAKQDEVVEEKYSPEENLQEKTLPEEKESPEEKDSLAEKDPSVEKDPSAGKDSSAEKESREERDSLEVEILPHAEESSGEGERSNDEVSEKTETEDSGKDHDEL